MLQLIGPASGAGSLIKTHRKRVLPASIAAWADTHSFVLARQESGYSTTVGSAISGLLGIGGKGGFLQATDARRPIWEFDADLGRPTARFAADFTSYMTGNAMTYTGPFTLAAVIKAPVNKAKVNQCIFGAYGASAPERAFLNLAAGAAEPDDGPGLLQAFYGDDGNPAIGFPGEEYFGNRLTLFTMAYDGSTYLKVRINGGSIIVGDPIDTEPVSTTALRLGYSGSGTASFSGLLDCALSTTSDLLANTNADKLADFDAFARGYYGAALSM